MLVYLNKFDFQLNLLNRGIRGMAAKYSFHGNVQAAAIGENSSGTINIGNNVQIHTVDDLKASLCKLITDLRADSSVDFDILSSINYLKDHAGDLESPKEAPAHWEKLKQYGGDICKKLYDIGTSACGTLIETWIIEGLKSLIS